jgi:two-component system cell cycle sensor histidine kinase/response regulator CckA
LNGKAASTLESERRLAEELERVKSALAESERRFAVLFRDNPGALSLSRLADSRFLDVNDAFAALVGLSREALIGRSSLELGLWPDPEERRRVFQPIVEQGSSYRVPARVVSAQGEAREARVSGQLLELDGDPCILILAEDVTELNRTQRALTTSEARFRAAAEGSLDGFLMFEAECDPSGAVVDFAVLEANDRACRSLGHPHEQVLGRRLSELLRAEDFETRLARLREVFESGQAGEGEIRVSPRGRRGRWLHQQVVPLERGVAEWTRDVSDRRAAEKERHRLEAEFHRGQRLESLGLLAGGVAHDFNNLLTGIVGYADVALRRLPEGADARPPVQEILLAARRATDLTQKMLAFAGGGPLEFAWTSLNEVVLEMVDLARPALPRERSVELRLGQPAPGLEADATQMRQVVLNLLLNASEAIQGAGGTIEVATGEVSCERDRLAAAVLGAELAEGRYAFVRIDDDGVGMAPEVRERIFEPFFTTKFTGRGLGLAAVLGIVRAHRGAIEVDSEAARGTSITVLLPLAQPAAG